MRGKCDFSLHLSVFIGVHLWLLILMVGTEQMWNKAIRFPRMVDSRNKPHNRHSFTDNFTFMFAASGIGQLGMRYLFWWVG